MTGQVRQLVDVWGVRLGVLVALVAIDLGMTVLLMAVLVNTPPIPVRLGPPAAPLNQLAPQPGPGLDR